MGQESKSVKAQESELVILDKSNNRVFRSSKMQLLDRTIYTLFFHKGIIHHFIFSIRYSMHTYVLFNSLKTIESSNKRVGCINIQKETDT